MEQSPVDKLCSKLFPGVEITSLIQIKRKNYIHKDRKFYQSQSIMSLCHHSKDIQFLVRFLDCYFSLLALSANTQSVDLAPFCTSVSNLLLLMILYIAHLAYFIVSNIE